MMKMASDLSFDSNVILARDSSQLSSTARSLYVSVRGNRARDDQGLHATKEAETCQSFSFLSLLLSLSKTESCSRVVVPLWKCIGRYEPIRL